MILTYPNEKLREKCKPVTQAQIKSGGIKKLITKMRDELAKAGGIGLAAIQIGELLRVILVEIEEGCVKAYINPEITRRSFKKIAIEEGCLSVPGKAGYVKRSKISWVHALNEDGEKIKFKVNDLESIIFQHEIDHLNGILFIDKIVKKNTKS